MAKTRKPKRTTGAVVGAAAGGAAGNVLGRKVQKPYEKRVAGKIGRTVRATRAKYAPLVRSGKMSLAHLKEQISKQIIDPAARRATKVVKGTKVGLFVGGAAAGAALGSQFIKRINK